MVCFITYHFMRFSMDRAYLGDRHIVSYESSASTWFLARAKKHGHYDHDLVVRSQQLYGNSSVAQGIAAVLPSSKIISGSNSSAEILTRHVPASRFIHLETHVDPHPDNGLLSAWFLGADKLTILDSFNLRLPCSLISLIGTAPGLHSSGNGEEINLLARGFEYAGAKSVLMPLWASDDTAIATLLEAFYRIAHLQPDRGIALQQAAVSVREKFPCAYYWASYVLRGSAGTSEPSAIDTGPVTSLLLERSQNITRRLNSTFEREMLLIAGFV